MGGGGHWANQTILSVNSGIYIKESVSEIICKVLKYDRISGSGFQVPSIYSLLDMFSEI